MGIVCGSLSARRTDDVCIHKHVVDEERVRESAMITFAYFLNQSLWLNWVWKLCRRLENAPMWFIRLWVVSGNSFFGGASGKPYPEVSSENFILENCLIFIVHLASFRQYVLTIERVWVRNFLTRKFSPRKRLHGETLKILPSFWQHKQTNKL